jgi:hypothetical protein
MPVNPPVECVMCKAARQDSSEPPAANCDWFCPACGEVDHPGGVFVPWDVVQEEVKKTVADAQAAPKHHRPVPRAAFDSPARAAAPSPLPKPAVCGGSALDAILSTLAQSGSGSSATVLRPSLFAGHLLRHDAAPADGIVWRGCLALLGAAADASEDAQTALKAALSPSGILHVTARGPAAGAPGAGPEGSARAAAVGRLLPGETAVQCAWWPNTAVEIPQPGECLAALRITAADGHDAAFQAVLGALEHHAGCLRADVSTPSEMVLWILPPAALPPAFRPRSVSGSQSCLYALVVEAPLPPLVGVPPADAHPARGILAPYPAPHPDALPIPPFVDDEGDGPPASVYVPIHPISCPVLAGLRITLLGYSEAEPVVQEAVAHGAVLVPAAEASPEAVDVLVLDPARMMLLSQPDFPIRMLDFLLHRHVTCVLGLDYLAACAAAATALPPWQAPRAGHELFPSGIAVVTDADTLASGADITRTALGLLSRCAAASNAADAATYGGGMHKACTWRLLLRPAEHAALSHVAKSATSPYGSEAWAAYEEARTSPGPGVGAGAGVARAAVLSAAEVSRSTVADPPQELRDAIKVAAVHAADCRLVLLMTNRQDLLASLRHTKTVGGGTPAECFALLQRVLDQARRQVLLRSGDANGNARMEAAPSEGVAEEAAGRKVSFSAEVESLPLVQCPKLGKARKRERGEFVAEEGPRKEARVEEGSAPPA